jgi:hypothetical protein
MRDHDTLNRWRLSLTTVGLCSLLSAVGCQVDVGGQTLPSPWYQHDDIQYFAPGPEFKLSREAAAQKAFSQDQALQGAGVVPGRVPVVPGAAPVEGPPVNGGAVPVVPVPADALPAPDAAAPVAPAPENPLPPDGAAPDAAAPDAGIDMGFDNIQ